MKFTETLGKSDRGITFSIVSSPASRETLVLVMGYAGSRFTWPRQFVEKLAQRFTVVTLDNRGTGESIKPEEPTAYTVEEMSLDLKSVIDKMGCRELHLLGYSLGGCIAQQFALENPQLLKTLILMSTTGGGSMYVSPSKSVSEALSSPKGETIWELYLSTWRQCLSAESILKYDVVLNEIFERSLKNMTPRFALKGHLHAYNNFDSAAFLEKLKMPILVISGEGDRLTPLGNSQNLAAKIPGAKLIVIPNCEHAPHIEGEGQLLREIFAFTQKS
jgi:3-oxoadipate enol-lactonase